MRLRHKPWAKDYLENQPEYVLTSLAQKQQNWREIFGNENPLFVEVGTGKGQFLNEMSKLYSDVNFIGLEKFESVLVTAVERAVAGSSPNLKFILGNAADLLDYFHLGEIDRLYVNFTDPWPKKRHEKRRLTYSSFLALYEKVLRPGGEIHLKTDNQGLFEYSIESLSQYGLMLKNISLDLHQEEQCAKNVMTEYEEKFTKKGQPIYRLEAAFPNKI
ncbi:tRNA (guanosine(46)-N7)-methyltransferase TrmB [Bacillus piscicola]|uniref:tRNA (guanosine(46)-N7)-methyltransferase TrmB n=1 Tax=Bacillus piscicola TaxID=1632684 RepID=UPI001F09A5BD|nr:tRNA (guanosine(46)-N7)-methyltransferase TrmB [Bacillus piscicola]